MALLLQPVFVDLHAPTVDSDSDSATSAHCVNLAGTVLSPDASEASLYSMWKVATKVKSVMAEGARFENLTWRAWHRKTQLEKIERARRESGELGISCEPVESEEFTDPNLVPSQATAIPRQILGKSFFNNGYSSILAEIQQASVRLGTGTPRAMTEPPSPMETALAEEAPAALKCSSSPTNTTITSTTTTTTTTTTTSESIASQSSVATNSIQSARRRKKNVDRFIRRQQLHTLEKIAEQAEESKSSSYSGVPLVALPPKAPVAVVHPLEYSSVSTNDTISIGSIGDGIPRTRTEGGEGVLDSKALFKRPEQPTQRTPSSPSSDRPSISLLTILLHRSAADAKRPESCPPPNLSMSPPNRPGAPVPTDPSESSSNSLECSEPARPSSPSSSSSPRQTTSGTSGASISPQRRRRGAPNPSEYTTPLYIW